MAVNVGGDDGGMMASINITPFTDVLLVLLIIFMVAATAVVKTGFNINLPKASTSTSDSPDLGIVVSIAVPDRLSVSVNGNAPAAIAGDALEGFLSREHRNLNTDRVIIMAENNVEYREVVHVMDQAKRASLTSIALATNAPDPSSKTH